MTTIQHKPKHTFPRLLFRFLAGRPMDGIHRTNSTWLRRADRDLTVRGRASRWHHLPGYHRTAWRIGGASVLLSAAYGYAVARTLTLIAIFCGLAGSLAFAAWYLRKSLRLRSHRKHLVSPLYKTLSANTGHAPNDNPERHLKIPLGYRNDEKACVWLSLPPEWEGTVTQQKALSALMARRLGGEWDAQYYHHARPPYAEFKPAPQPPSRVSFADIKTALETGDTDTLILGIGSRGTIIKVSLDSDSPHIALSIGTGGGKSTVVRAVIAYLRHHGIERIDVIDPKRVSQNWAKSIPGVWIWRNVAAQCEAIHNVKLRMESRYDALDTDETLQFPRHVLIIEEQNSFIDAAGQYWEDYRRELEPAERARVPKKNPAIADLKFILLQGRQSNINVISVLQRQSAAASGGGDMRSQYGAKLLARWDRPTWRMLMGTTYKAPSRINGRALFVLGDDELAVQMPFLTEPEACAYALSGPVYPVPSPDGSPLRLVPSAGIPAGASPEDELMSLREIAEAAIVPIRYGALLKARQRDREFPSGVKRGNVTLYRPGDMRLWEANRLRRVK